MINRFARTSVNSKGVIRGKAKALDNIELGGNVVWFDPFLVVTAIDVSSSAFITY